MNLVSAFNQSLELVADRCEDVVPPVYAELFQRYPEFEELFVLDTDMGARGHMLNEALTMAEGLLRNDPIANSFVSAERMNHEGYGIQDDAFEAFYAVMADVFRDLSGDDWSEDMTVAWDAVSDAVKTAKL